MHAVLAHFGPEEVGFDRLPVEDRRTGERDTLICTGDARGRVRAETWSRGELGAGVRQVAEEILTLRLLAVLDPVDERLERLRDLVIRHAAVKAMPRGLDRSL